MKSTFFSLYTFHNVDNFKHVCIFFIPYETVLESDWPNPVMASAEIKYVPEQEYAFFMVHIAKL